MAASAATFFCKNHPFPKVGRFISRKCLPSVMFRFLVLIVLLSYACGNPRLKTSDTENPLNETAASARLLFFSKTAAFRHESIPSGLAALQRIAQQSNWQWVATERSTIFHPDSLPRFDAIVLLNTTGDVFDDAQQEALRRYVRAGGALVGIHAATDTAHDWPWYQKAMAAKFDSHPAPQEARLIVRRDQDHPATRHLPAEWRVYDEWYYFAAPVGDYVTPLLFLDRESITGGKSSTGQHPLCWYHEYDGGRVFYTALGHTEAIYQNPAYLQHLQGAIDWALAPQNH